MARPWRIQYPDAVYHLTSRGNNQAPIFLSDADRRDFLRLLVEAVKRFRLEIFAFCLMDNHYHLFLRTPEANLSAAFHWLNATYTIRFQRRHHQCGHFLQGRFKAVLVLEQAHWHHLSMYVHLNPVRAGIVSDPADYEWSSFRDYIRARPRYDWLQRDQLLSEYGAGAARLGRYQRECRALAGVKPDFVEQLKSGVAIGAKRLVDQLLEKFRPAGDPDSVPSYKKFKKLARPEINVKRELARVAKVFRVKPEELLERRRNFPGRKAAYWHLVEHCQMSVTAAARLMKVKTTAVSLGIKSFKLMREKDRRLRMRTESLITN